MSEPLQFECPKCGPPAKVSAELHGTHWQCQRCGLKFKIPEPLAQASTSPSAAVSPPASAAKPGNAEPALIHVTCKCGKHFRARPEYAGRTARCPSCREKIVIPAAAGRNDAGTPATAGKLRPPDGGTRGRGDAERARQAPSEIDSDSAPGPRRRRPLFVLVAVGGVLLLAGGAFLLRRVTEKPPQDQAATAGTEQADTPAHKPVRPEAPGAKTTTVAKSDAQSTPTIPPAAVEAPPTTRPAQPKPSQAAPVAVTAVHRADERSGKEPTIDTPADDALLVANEELAFQASEGTITGLVFTPDGRYLISSTSRGDSPICLWEPLTGTRFKAFKVFKEDAGDGLALSGDGKHLLSNDRFQARLWDVETAQELGIFEGFGGAVTDMEFAHRGSLALIAAYDATVRLYDVNKIAEIKKLTDHTGTIRVAAFSPDDRLVAGGGRDGAVYLWDVDTGRVVRHWAAKVPRLTTIAFSPDGKSLLTAGRFKDQGDLLPDSDVENPLCLWDLDGKEIRRFPAHPEGVSIAVLSPDGRFVLTVNHVFKVKRISPYGSGSITLWEVASGRVLCRFRGHPSRTHQVCFSPDGRHVASAGSETRSPSGDSIKVWRIPDSIRIEPAEPPVLDEQRGLPDISKVLTYQVPALIEADQLAEAHERIEEARRDLEQFAVYSGVPRWDNSVGGLLRLADTKQLLLVKKGYVAPGSGLGGGSEEGDLPGPPSTERLTSEQNRELAAIRAGLSQATQSIRQGKFASGQSEIFQAQEQLRAFVDASGVPEWHLAVASVYQLAARRQTELDNRRGVEESRTAALAAEAAKKKADAATPSSASQALRVGQPAPLFTAATVDGKPFALQQFRKTWVLIDFWATWCGPCRAEMPNLKDVYATFGKDKRFAMISLSIDNQVDDPLQYAQQNGLGWVQGFLGQGWNSPVLKMYHVHGIPAMFLIDPDGKIAATGLRGERIKSAIAEALKGK